MNKKIALPTNRFSLQDAPQDAQYLLTATSRSRLLSILSSLVPEKGPFGPTGSDDQYPVRNGQCTIHNATIFSTPQGLGLKKDSAQHVYRSSEYDSESEEEGSTGVDMSGGLFGNSSDSEYDSEGDIATVRTSISQAAPTPPRAKAAKNTPSETFSPERVGTTPSTNQTPLRVPRDGVKLNHDTKQFLGAGGEGEVHSIQTANGHYHVVSKLFSPTARNILRQMRLNKSRPQHIITAIVDEQGHLYLPQANTDLFSIKPRLQELIRSIEYPALKKAFVLNLAIQILQGIKEFQSISGHLHHDLKPENILLFGRNRLMIADYGNATPAGTMPEAISPGYNAPEVQPMVKRRFGDEPAVGAFPTTVASDLFSYAAIMIEILMGQQYFKLSRPDISHNVPEQFPDYFEYSHQTTLKKLVEKQDQFNWCSKLYHQCIGLLQLKPQERPCFTESFSLSNTISSMHTDYQETLESVGATEETIKQLWSTHIWKETPAQKTLQETEALTKVKEE